MPFYNAGKKLLLLVWASCAKSVFVARGLRYFQAIKGEDDNGDSQFVIRMRKVYLDLK